MSFLSGTTIQRFLKVYIIVLLGYLLFFRGARVGDEQNVDIKPVRKTVGSFLTQQKQRICQCHCPKQQCDSVRKNAVLSEQEKRIAVRKHNGPSEDCLLTLVLPIVESDLPRLRLLDLSFNKFFNFSRVCEILMVGIDKQYGSVLNLVSKLHLAKYLKIRLVNESDVVPEFKRVPDTPNWIRQQIIKLSIAEKVNTKFYMCMDCDMLNVKTCGVSELFEGERAKTNMSPKEKPAGSMAHWWDGAVKVLNVTIPERYQYRFGVTPAILSKDIVMKIREHIELRFNRPWRQHLIDRIWDSWTEYCVYSTYAMASDMFDTYHATTFDAVYKQFDLNVWYVNMFDNWPVEKVFNPEIPGCFVLVQSNTKIGAEKTEEKVLKYIT
mmetsp:Transcript_12246/g.19784  ORF Transcript_12246/g.19784 Transcript_12246/m.19784 type:complete len:380 (-) Transcript_12246:151-1290(-)|eukprot:CAMPEP_0184672758 /NCGR_PEP_ID=MMETSP0308-20130426/86288_1 /TAXON_ID=38269 /ORGANISM="Gloeochaete witrockiana, Strain SAG 46.84" /LENGTH=379 /DNA_ID=CAMNT_0027120145 /DNA_START=79 /DNA_END=1218 /DNA_ORIENTATION=+